MAITSYSTTRLGDTTVVTVTSDLTDTIYYHWYVDGQWVGMTTQPSRGFQVSAGEQLRVECLDTNDADYDYTANAPEGWPARKTLWWVRSLATDVDHYRIDQQEDGGAWETIGRVWPVLGQWSYRHTTERLTDLAVYSWRILPVDAAGNEGAATTIGPEQIVRAPDAPAFAAAFDPDTRRVTFAAPSP